MTRTTAAQNNAVTSRATYHDSGFMFAASALRFQNEIPAGSGKFLPSSFEATFPNEGAFRYSCNVHGIFMSGGVGVS